MKFYIGMHHPAKARHLDRAMVSINVLRGRVSDFEVGEWLLDSGAFTTLAKHGGYPRPPEDYAAEVNRWRRCGDMRRAATQDWMCEEFMLTKTGLSVWDHQRLTIDRFDALRSLCGPIIMPVLQGWHPADYARHVADYGSRLAPGEWCGIGSVCKRQGKPSAIAAVLDAVLVVRPDLRLHGFGVKVSALADSSVRDRLYSADSMAWSFAARYQGRDGNSWREAAAYAERVEAMPVQESWL